MRSFEVSNTSACSSAGISSMSRKASLPPRGDISLNALIPQSVGTTVSHHLREHTWMWPIVLSMFIHKQPILYLIVHGTVHRTNPSRTLLHERNIKKTLGTISRILKRTLKPKPGRSTDLPRVFPTWKGTDSGQQCPSNQVITWWWRNPCVSLGVRPFFPHT